MRGETALNNSLMKRIICGVIAISIVVVSAMSICAASPNLSLTLGSQKSSGEEIIIPVMISSADGKTIRFSGFSGSLKIDQNLSEYVSSGETFALSVLASETEIYVNGNQINYAWYGDEVSIPSGAALFYFRIRPKTENSSSDKKISLTFTMKNFYTYSFEGNNLVWLDYTFNSNTAKLEFLNGAMSNEAKRVIALIDAISTVTYSEESLKKINDAAHAYALLTVAQKSEVTNVNVLIAAREEYDRLKNLSIKQELQKKIDEYVTKHKKILEKSSESIVIEDEKLIDDAIEDYTNLDSDAKYELFSKYQKLKGLKATVDLLKKENAQREPIEKQKKEALEYVETFRKEFKYWLELDPNSVTSEHYNGLNNAVETLNTLISVNPYVGEYLSVEKQLLESMLKKAEELKSATGNSNDLKEIQVAKFKRSFSWLISADKKNLSYDDLIDINTAIQIYNFLDADVQKSLSAEYEKLQELLSYVEGLNPDENGDTQQNASTTTISDTKVVKKGIGSNLQMLISNRSIGMFCLYLIPLSIISTLIFAILQIFYHLYVKKHYIHEAEECEEI